MPSWVSSAAVAAVLLAVAAGLFRAAAVCARRNPSGVSAIPMRWPADFLLLAFLAASAAFAGMSVSGAFVGKLGAENPLSVFLPTIAMQVFTVAAVLIFQKLSDADFSIGFGFSRGALRSAGVFFACAAPAVLAANALVASAYFAVSGEYPPKQEIVDIFSSMPEGLGAVAAAVSIAVFAPVTEEMFFRGLLYRIFKGFFSPFRCGAFVSAVLSGAFFAMIHADAFVFLPLALMGVLLCMSYEKSGSIISPILVHALFNALNLGIIWIVK